MPCTWYQCDLGSMEAWALMLMDVAHARSLSAQSVVRTVCVCGCVCGCVCDMTHTLEYPGVACCRRQAGNMHA